MAKIKSKYLEQEFTAATFDSKTSENSDVTIITHNSLEDVILNQVSSEIGVRYDENIEHICETPMHVIVKCTICDKAGRRVVCFGEALSDTLNTDIARCNPVMIAEKRAFDRAAIRYLNIPGRIYSDQEGVEDDPAPKGDAAAAKEGAKRPQRKAKETEPPKAKEASSAAITSVPVNTSTEEEVPDFPSANDEDELAKVGAVAVKFGKFSSVPRSVADICEDEKESSWVQFVTKGTFKARGKESQDQVNAIKRYLELTDGSEIRKGA